MVQYQGTKNDLLLMRPIETLENERSSGGEKVCVVENVLNQRLAPIFQKYISSLRSINTNGSNTKIFTAVG